MNITSEQRRLLSKYGILESSDENELLLAIDEKITQIGFDADYALNNDGKILQALYDEMYDE